MHAHLLLSINAPTAAAPSGGTSGDNAFYSSVGSCYIHGSGTTCNVAEADCTGSNYAPGYVSGHSGCCHCEGGCVHADETEGSDCGPYPDTITSVGSCYIHGGDPSTTCNVAEADCTGTSYAPGYVSGYSGCCHCLGNCDHTAETDGADCTYPDDPDARRLSFVDDYEAEAMALENKKYKDLKDMEFWTMNKARRDAILEEQSQRKLAGWPFGCKYSDVCCKNPTTGDCVLMGYPPAGHDDVDMNHCPTADEGASGLFSEHVNETLIGRWGDCCKEEANSVEWTYEDGTSTGADIDGNTGCQRDGTCDYGDEVCCYNTFLDHKCYIYKGLEKQAQGNYGQTNVGCPVPPGDGWVYESSEEDGRNNGCCEDMTTSMPHNFGGEAVDGQPCFIEGVKTQLLADCTEYTGGWIGYIKGADPSPTNAGFVYAHETAAVEAGCNMGDWASKRADGCNFDVLNLSGGAARMGGGLFGFGFGFGLVALLAGVVAVW
ncbi:hypothetical protein TL16_g03531 [Triparma laevis f. inornata]|uniref:Uncharacterized protein n=1 Tax=Triparma laevis f. inornata TaxID=1714386 RepID=A0A9W7A4U4_9STRA|nr:hypothetical protein TL16_g03531 [Triparma laevis f. inornata]